MTPGRAQELEAAFPDHTPLLPPRGTPPRAAADKHMGLERELFGHWLRWLRAEESPPGRGARASRHWALALCRQAPSLSTWQVCLVCGLTFQTAFASAPQVGPGAQVVRGGARRHGRRVIPPPRPSSSE